MSQDDVSVRCTALTGSKFLCMSTTLSQTPCVLVFCKVAGIQSTAAVVLHVLEMVYSGDGGIVGEIRLDSCMQNMCLVVCRDG
jgi:hypothetical protein